MSWLEILAAVSLIVSAACAVAIVIDLVSGRAQRMWIMDVVWPVTCLWAGPLGLWLYLRYGRRGTTPQHQPRWAQVAKGTIHCGAGCTLGDIVAEWFAVGVPLALFGRHLFGSWVYDYVAAFALGILFQYFTIKPMKHLSRGDGVKEAFKADSLSLTCWQIGMYGGMAIATFAIFGHELDKTGPVFWFVMQLAMCLGFLTAYPINAWLLSRGIKEAM